MTNITGLFIGSVKPKAASRSRCRAALVGWARGLPSFRSADWSRAAGVRIERARQHVHRALVAGDIEQIPRGGYRVAVKP